MSTAPSSLQFAYVNHESDAANPFVDLATTLSKRCGARTVSHAPDTGDLALDAEQGKHVVSISLPALEDGQVGRVREEKQHG